MSAPLRLPVVEGPVRPRTRAECRDGERPCPWASCVHHTVAARFRASGESAHDEAIFAEVFEGGEAAPMSCELDAAEAGGVDRADVAAVLGVTPQRVEQIERRALLLLQESPALASHADSVARSASLMRIERVAPAPAVEAPREPCVIPGCGSERAAWRERLEAPLRDLCAGHRRVAQRWLYAVTRRTAEASVARLIELAKLPAAGPCAVPGCASPAAPWREVLPVPLRDLCETHRLAAQCRRRDCLVSDEAAAAWVVARYGRAAEGGAT